MTLDPKLKIWGAGSEADFDGWDLRIVEDLGVNGRHVVTVALSFRQRIP
jgi:hypothetical protein